jgi:hypothetical protein
MSAFGGFVIRNFSFQRYKKRGLADVNFCSAGTDRVA